MKKTIIWILAMVMLLSLCACSSQTEETDVPNETENQGQQNNQKPTEKNPAKPLTVDDVMAAPETDAGDFWYEVTDAGVEIKKYEGEGGIVVVPAEIEGVDVVLIGEDAFANADKVTAVKLPDTVQRVEDQAFVNCTSMEIFVSGAGVIYLGEYAFNACISLSTVILSDVLEVIDDMCFASTALTEVELPSTVVEINYAFRGKSAEEPITIVGETGSYVEQYVQENGESRNLVFRAK